MKKLYVSPAIEVSTFIAEDIVCASTVTFDGINYNVVENGVAVAAGEVQLIDTSKYTTFGD